MKSLISASNLSELSSIVFIDEICRVMKNLASVIYEHLFPNSCELIKWEFEHDGRLSVPMTLIVLIIFDISMYFFI